MLVSCRVQCWVISWWPSGDLVPTSDGRRLAYGVGIGYLQKELGFFWPFSGSVGAFSFGIGTYFYIIPTTAATVAPILRGPGARILARLYVFT